ncbi:GntR family transcriptional regulator [Anaerocolumna aminovalerica]|jgi:GntR family transcriptional regulator|uniref:DNA-binding transcriptional regulator YhcF, GntR family n=1 Tax=Anaerocolumna aminovalerica TaxID=1527 RepID=A0A1I5BJP1_9FIRM|nr:GntR family transcriptional regulator [Anaerocolumna aminovalerica]MBU5330572.1 GntR family transcriptional regulator [Anaerocolumna aminovalerica]MDU6265765.1 GntR family transcriptional regulator [Anaerocolumna aminovalerica]SFN74887.1 DNA-binding transcriptional regulator YhcF, GntR family [Anaerocolumna aminovalerica]
MQWELNSERPVYLQLIEQIQAGIISGYFKPGDKLPSVRDLAADAAVNPNTMQRAFTELERTGLVYTNRTSGRFITSDEKLIKELKEQSAINEIKEFLNKMKQLGLDTEEIIEVIRNLAKELG